VSKTDGVFIPRELFDFLMGEGEIEGTSFGDLNSGRIGRFWWRALLRCAERAQERADASETSQGGHHGQD
jgi:hypothetical protein